MKTRSIIGYYGGKSTMSNFIAERLDYKHSHTYIEMFGGGARVLLNKPRHANEIYSDYGSALTKLMQVMADEKQSREFIYRLRDTECSIQEFERAKRIVDFVDSDPLEYYAVAMQNELKRLFIKYGILPPASTKRDLNKLLKANAEPVQLKQHTQKAGALFSQEELSYLKRLYLRYDYLKGMLEEDGFLKRNQDLGLENALTDIDIAVAAYVVYNQSRDNMGQYWSKDKFRSNEAYYNRMGNLYECAERMQGINVFQLDAMIFFDKTYYSESGDRVSQWLEDDGIMMYADPSYISPVHEAQILKDIDWEHADCISRELAKHPKDLGKVVYAKSFSYIQQEDFLRSIVNAKCKMMISNYDLILYNKYLNEETGWRKIYFETTTTVGNKKDNKRVECLWYNY